MSRIAQPNYSEALKEIRRSINNLSKDMSEIKALLARVVGEKDEESLRQKLYPWHFPNVSTSGEYHEEEQ
jgi:hypothetical protein|tara:strand:- start:202 stop:411 length:210 start_codon:yes stop_codon:yes gene_type:complete